MEKVRVNDEACIGCGACMAIASDVFEINDEGLAKAKEDNNIIDNMDSKLKEDVMDAVEGCPTSAIQIEKND